MSPAKLTALKLLLMPLCLGRRHKGSPEGVRLEPQARCMLEDCYSTVWVVDAPWGHGVFSAECLPYASLTSVIKRSLGPRSAGVGSESHLQALPPLLCPPSGLS